MKMFMKRIAIIASMATITGCASIVSNSQYQVAIQSEPSGAEFTVVDRNNKIVHAGKTPKVIKLKSGAGYFKAAVYEITFIKKGYPTHKMTLKATLDGWYFGNFAIGGPLGLLVIDPATGAMYKLPQNVEVNLRQPTSNLTIRSFDSLSDEEKSRLIAVN
ncbi:MAG: hypothetical protein Q4A60_04970 [Pasteurellaceae bacterium]|nr:hypothetical protein [Pasteurellaceae bacterium]